MPWGLRPYLQDKAIRAGAVVLVHFVDDQEDDTGEEGQSKENQHRDLWEEARNTLGPGEQLTDRQKQSQRKGMCTRGDNLFLDILYGFNFPAHRHVIFTCF